MACCIRQTKLSKEFYMPICSAFGIVGADFGSVEELDDFLGTLKWHERKGQLAQTFRKNELVTLTSENRQIAQQIISSVLANDYH